MLVIAATAGTAAAVSVSGLIAFVGIIVPNTIRLLVSTSYRAVVPLSFVVGAGFLVRADVLARTIVSPAELPIGVVTAFFGAPFFAVVLRSAMTMSPDAGGIFDTLLGLVRRGLGGRASDGRQFVSWIHETDFVQATRWLIDHEARPSGLFAADAAAAAPSRVRAAG